MDWLKAVPSINANSSIPLCGLYLPQLKATNNKVNNNANNFYEREDSKYKYILFIKKYTNIYLCTAIPTCAKS